MLSSDSYHPMTCGFVCENRMFLTNRGHFGALRQKLGNDRALTMAGDFENSRAELKSESAPVPLRTGGAAPGRSLAFMIALLFMNEI